MNSSRPEPTNGRYGRRGLPREVIDGIRADYLRLRSCAKVAALWGRTRQSIHDILSRRKETNRRLLIEDDVVFWGGEKFTPGKNGYLRRTRRHGHEEQQLHRILWSAAHGPIPHGHQVMFKDGDKRNLALDNLVCLPVSEVSRHTATGSNGSTKARHLELAMSMERYIEGQAARYAGAFSCEAADLKQVGLLTALRAAEKYDEAGGASFFGYSKLWIRSQIIRAAQKEAMVVTVPLARQFEIGIKRVSFDAPIHEDGTDTLADRIASQVSDPCEDAHLSEASSALLTELEQLPSREREILRSRFFHQETLDEIACRFGLTRQRIAQLEKQALKRLRKSDNLKRMVE